MSNASDGDEDLRKSISRNEARAEWGGAAVVFGLVVEVVLTATYRHGESTLEGWGPVFADALIALGVAAEILFARKARSRSETLQLRSDEKVAEANARAAEATQRAQEAILELARLEKKITPRVITADGEAKIVDALKSFPGIPFFVEADPAAEYGFIDRLITVLQRSGWKWMGYAVSPRTLPRGNFGIDIPEAAISGVKVRINESRIDDFRKPAEALSFALTQAISASEMKTHLLTPIRTAHEVFPQAAHPTRFFGRVMCRRGHGGHFHA